MAVLWLVGSGHEDFEDADIMMQQMGKWKRKGNLQIIQIFFTFYQLLAHFLSFSRLSHTSFRLVTFFHFSHYFCSSCHIFSSFINVRHNFLSLWLSVQTSSCHTCTFFVYRCQFHQRFSRAFFVRIFGAKTNVTRENDVRMLLKLTAGGPRNLRTF
jgi:hypothetical protein